MLTALFYIGFVLGLLVELLCYALWLRRSSPKVARIEDALLARACTLVVAVEAVHHGGEAKRHQVYAALLKEFPQRSKRDVSQAIEHAVETLL